ncbi:calmodulin-binding protein 25-like [Typha angustifolia]|uniref:calmodulin-binding protein 25-like n=1 Tax=Typha angustifolia TaxID=59011 RepID=UPI003C308987
MAGNCSSLDSWIFSAALSRENEAFTRALQISLSDNNNNNNNNSSPSSSSADSFLFTRLPLSEPAGPVRSNRIGSPIAPTGRVGKRKSRASKRTPTTYITADPANFREMVQQVTGIRLGSESIPADPVSKPEPQRTVQQSCLLPTLDTSALWLNRASSVEPVDAFGIGSYAPVGVDSSAFDFEALPSFPTLDSWGVM